MPTLAISERLILASHSAYKQITPHIMEYPTCPDSIPARRVHRPPRLSPALARRARMPAAGRTARPHRPSGRGIRRRARCGKRRHDSDIFSVKKCYGANIERIHVRCPPLFREPIENGMRRGNDPLPGHVPAAGHRSPLIAVMSSKVADQRGRGMRQVTPGSAHGGVAAGAAPPSPGCRSR